MQSSLKIAPFRPTARAPRDERDPVIGWRSFSERFLSAKRSSTGLNVVGIAPFFLDSEWLRLLFDELIEMPTQWG